MSKKEENNFLFRLVHLTVLELAKNELKIKTIENLLKYKNVIDPNELEEKWNNIFESDLKMIFEKIEKNLGFENIKLVFKKNGYIHISGLQEE